MMNATTNSKEGRLLHDANESRMNETSNIVEESKNPMCLRRPTQLTKSQMGLIN